MRHSGSTKMAYMIQDKPPSFYEKVFDQQRPRYRDPRQISINIREVAFQHCILDRCLRCSTFSVVCFVITTLPSLSTLCAILQTPKTYVIEVSSGASCSPMGESLQLATNLR